MVSSAGVPSGVAPSRVTEMLLFDVTDISRKAVDAVLAAPGVAARLPALGERALDHLASIDRRLGRMQESLDDLPEIRRAVEPLDGRLESLDALAALSEIRSAVAPLDDRLEGLSGGIQALEREVADVAKGVRPLDEHLKQVNENTGELGREVASIQPQVDAIAGPGLEQLAGGVEHLVRQLDHLVERLDEMHKTLDGLKASVQDATEHMPGNDQGLMARAREAITGGGESS